VVPGARQAPEAKQDLLGQQARDHEQGVLLVGVNEGPGRFAFGTAFVISRQSRLLATNAHVADLWVRTRRLEAHLGGSDRVFSITQRPIYHPHVIRRRKGPDGAIQLVRSTDPNVGPVHPDGPDVAVMRVDDDGQALPVEWPLASVTDVRVRLLGQPVGLIGFPAYDVTSWPDVGDSVAPEVQTGLINRETDFNNDPGAGLRNLQWIQHSAQSWPGISGSPVFLPNGRVIAIHNAGQDAINPSGEGEIRSIPKAVRIDCLWELLAFISMANPGTVPRELQPPDPADLIARSFVRSDQDMRRQEQVIRVLHDTPLMLARGEYLDLIRHLDRAISLAPNNADLYGTRAIARLSHAQTELKKAGGGKKYPPDDPEAINTFYKNLNPAIKDINKAIKLAPNDRRLQKGELSILQGLASVSGNKQVLEAALHLASKLLESEKDPREKTDLLITRSELYRVMGRDQDQLADLNAAVATAGSYDRGYKLRAVYWRKHGRDDLAEADEREVRARGGTPLVVPR
jgi:S1-C subfamily serine protease